jgi:AdoMet-dependent heme synthase
MENMPSGREFEQTFAVLHKLAQQVPFKIKTAEAQHYRRHVLQQKARERNDKLWRSQSFSEGIPGVLPVNEAKATLFISSTGEVSPEPALKMSAGNIRVKKLVDIYRKSELFTSLRDPENLKGKCGECGFHDVCGGSRARALVINGDLFQEDATCIYQPGSETRVRNRQAPELPPLEATVEEP